MGHMGHPFGEIVCLIYRLEQNAVWSTCRPRPTAEPNLERLRPGGGVRRVASKAEDYVAAEHEGVLVAPRIEGVSSVERTIVANLRTEFEGLDWQVDLRPVDVRPEAHIERNFAISRRRRSGDESIRQSANAVSV